MVAQNQSFLFEHLKARVTHKGKMCIDRGAVSRRISFLDRIKPGSISYSKVSVHENAARSSLQLSQSRKTPCTSSHHRDRLCIVAISSKLICSIAQFSGYSFDKLQLQLLVKPSYKCFRLF